MWLMKRFDVIVSTIFIICKGVATAESGCVPYAASEPGQSRACVCNSSYCDVIAPPTPLPRGQFHVYSTSKARPGFTHTTGSFGPATEGPRNQADVVFTVNASQQYQEILGFGGTVSDSAADVINSLPEKAQEKLIESYFGRTGIEYSFIRVPIGSTDFSLRSYTFNDEPYDTEMKNFNLTEESFLYQIPLIRRAKSVSARGIRLLASSWSVPGWLKQTWAGNNFDGWLDPRFHDALAEYYVKFIQAYRVEGLDLWALTGGNEVILFTWMVMPGPTSNNKGLLNTTMMTADAQRDWLRRLRRKIGPEVKFIGLDDCRMFLKYWMRRMELDSLAFGGMDGVGLHWYFDWFTKPTTLDEFHHRYPEKLIMYTESSINSMFGDDRGVILGSWDRAEFYIENIIENVNHWTHGYIDWNLALNTEGGPTLLRIPLDAAIIVNETSGEFYKQPIFYAIGHFSKFILPGTKRIGLQLQSNRKEEEEQSKYAEKTRRQTVESLVLGKLGKGSMFPKIPLPTAVMGLATANPNGSCTLFIFNPRNESCIVRIEDSKVGTILKTIEEYSIHTFIYWDCQ